MLNQKQTKNMESFAPPVDQKTSNPLSGEAMPVTVMYTKLGGDRNGGEMSISSENEPLIGRDEGFGIGALPADLLAVIEPGAEGETYNRFGIVKTKLAGNETEEDDYMLVNLTGNQEAGYKVEETTNSKNPMAMKLENGKVFEFGRDSGNSHEDFRVRKDPSMSSRHLSIKLENGQVSIIDTKSLNGTEVKSMGVPDKFTKADLEADMAELRQEKGLKPKDVAEIGSGILGASGVDIAESAADLPPIPNLIDIVPKTPEEVEQVRARAEQRERQARLERNRPAINEAKAKVDDARARMDAAKEGLSEDESRLLWSAASALSRFKDMKRQGRAQDAINENMLYGEARQAIEGKGLIPNLDAYSDAFDSLRFYEDQVRSLEQ